MKRSCLILLMAGLMLNAGVASDDPKDDQEKIHGTWKVVSMEVRGKSLRDGTKNLRVVFTKDKMEFKHGDKSDGEFAYKLDSTKKPKWIDLAPIGKSGKPGKTAQGIYALEGNDLKICHPDPGRARSTEFTSSPDSILIILKREKP
jgi:uncharacterized protein (TIGR03067 family)